MSAALMMLSAITAPSGTSAAAAAPVPALPSASLRARFWTPTTGNGWHNYTLMTVHDGRFGVRFFSRRGSGTTASDKAESRTEVQADAVAAWQPVVLHATLRSSAPPVKTVRARTADMAEQANYSDNYL